ETFRVRLSRALGEDPRPGNREAVRVGADVLDQRHVLLVPVVMIVGDVAVVVVLDVAGGVRVAVPDGLTLAILGPGALDLVRGRRDPPVETLRETAKRSAWQTSNRGHGEPPCIGLCTESLYESKGRASPKMGDFRLADHSCVLRL